MNTLQAHKLLNNAYDTMLDWNTESTRGAVLELLAAYNHLASTSPAVYRQFKLVGHAAESFTITTV